MKIAIVGSGIAGLGAAHVLARAHDVHVLEADDRIGGHTHTVDVGGRPVDTGFIVHNRHTYPLLCRLLDELGVRTRETVMSFSVECECGVAWSSRRPWRAGRLLPEILRFLRTAGAADAAGKTFDCFVRDEGYSDAFRWHYVVPMTAALWSAAPDDALAFPAEYAIAFFRNHGMLGLRRHRWRTVVGGSRAYAEALVARLPNGVRTAAPVRAVTRLPEGVEIRVGDDVVRFDAVVLATHAPQALALLTDASEPEARLLGAFRTTENETVLHTDERLLPRRRSDRSAWNYRSPGCGVLAPRATVTYSSNRLQGLEGEEVCVTLNRTDEIDASRVVRTIRYAHPQVTFESLAAQRELQLLNGGRRTAFAGAWQGNGFHEDGLASGVRAAASLGVEW